jgi:predicted alpha/beta-hydrolase family hydrolase
VTRTSHEADTRTKTGRLEVESGVAVSTLVVTPPRPRAWYVLAHGAGAGMRHPFMESLARRLATHGIGTLRYQFPYTEQGSRRPDPEPLLTATVRAAVDAGREVAGDLPLLAGGKSMGGRMTSRAAAAEPLPGVRGLVFVGFPLHPAGRPGVTRAEHLSRVTVPMLFLQGTRDTLADLTLLEPIIERLGSRATMRVIADADHGFHVLKRSGRTDDAVLDELAAAVAGWREGLV